MAPQIAEQFLHDVVRYLGLPSCIVWPAIPFVILWCQGADYQAHGAAERTNQTMKHVIGPNVHAKPLETRQARFPNRLRLVDFGKIG